MIMGQVLQAGAGQIPARQAAVGAGIPMSVPALTINKVCLSGLDAIALADQLIRAGEFDIVVAGGMESMTNAPHLLLDQRQGYKYGDVTIQDHMALDGLTDAYDQVLDGRVDRAAQRPSCGITREEQDAFGAASHQRAAAAQKNGVFAEEIAPVEIPQRKGDPIVVSEDEGIRPDTTVESARQAAPGVQQGRHDHRRHLLADLRRRLRGRGDEQGEGRGAGPDLAGRDRRARQRGRPGQLAARQPANAIKHALGKAGLAVADLDLIEINEAFAAVGIAVDPRARASTRTIVNVNGGAIALGHPIGMSGARLVLTLALELKRRGGGLGAAALCGGGGQGDALIAASGARSRSEPRSTGPCGGRATSRRWSQARRPRR